MTCADGREKELAPAPARSVAPESAQDGDVGRRAVLVSLLAAVVGASAWVETGSWTATTSAAAATFVAVVAVGRALR